MNNMICKLCKNHEYDGDKLICTLRYYNYWTNDGYIKPGYVKAATCIIDPCLSNKFEPIEKPDHTQLIQAKTIKKQHEEMISMRKRIKILEERLIRVESTDNL